MSNEEATRELMWNIENSWIMYPCFLLALAIALYFFWKRYRLWKTGRPEKRSDQKLRRLRGSFLKGILQTTVIKEKGPGLMHIAMYLGFGVLLAATISMFLEADLGFHIVYGNFYLYFLSFTVDIAGLMFVVAMAGLIIRRMLKKNLESTFQDYLVLALLLAIGVSGFILEALRIEGTQDPWRAWSPVGNALSYLFTGLPDQAIHVAHQVVWWGHMALAFGVLAYWTYSKLVHVFLIPGSIYWRSLEPKGILPFTDLEDENLETMGVGVLEEFTWKDLYDTQACVRCGRCESNCPAYVSGKPLSPMKLMQDLGGNLVERGPLVIKQKRAQKVVAADDEAIITYSEEEQVILDKKLVGDVIQDETLWSCTTCGYCVEQCPALLEHVPKVVNMRTYQVSMESSFPTEAQSTFRNMETNGNPWGLGWQTRQNWMKDLEVPLIHEKPDAEYLYWPGCAGAFDSRNQKVSKALITLLNKAGVDYTVLGNEEKCCGETARRMGNEYVYFMLANENIATLESHGVKKIITQCPHCYNSFKVDYPQLGGDFEVVHHTDLLHKLIVEGKLEANEKFEQTVTYHDSCYLGRYQGIYDTPRDLLISCGATLHEMKLSRDKSFCCGAGGGRMWLEENIGDRINVLRTEQAQETNADMVATACPYCLTMFSDGVSTKEAKLEVKDIAEIMVETL